MIGLVLEGLGLLPSEDVPPKVSVAGRLLEDGVLQLQIPKQLDILKICYNKLIYFWKVKDGNMLVTFFSTHGFKNTVNKFRQKKLQLR